MNGVTLIVLFAVGAQADGKGVMDKLADQLADQLVNKFMNRALQAWAPESSDMDSTTLGKLAVAGRTGLVPPRNARSVASGNLASPWAVQALPRAIITQSRYKEMPCVPGPKTPEPRVYHFSSDGIQAMNQGEEQTAELSNAEPDDEIPCKEGCFLNTKPLESRVVDAMQLIRSAKEVGMESLRNRIDSRSKAAATMALSSMLVVTRTYNDINLATKDLSDAVPPIISSLKYGTGPLTRNAIGTLTAEAKEIIKAIDFGLDAFLSVPPEKFTAVVKALKSATSQTLTLEASEKVAATAAAALRSADEAKVMAFDKAMKAFSSVNKVALASVLITTSLSRDDVSKASAAMLEVVKASSA